MIFVGTQVVKNSLPRVVGVAMVQNTCKSLLRISLLLGFIGNILC